MNINTKGTYTIKGEKYEISINYSYYYNTGTYEQPPEEDMEIESVDLNGMDITNLFWDYIEDDVYSEVIEYAREQ
jgi:hypothetical protein|tara:strand:- start:442 stop:666 length:225 start_codon:yes stop_codon:yes gene_type:complete